MWLGSKAYGETFPFLNSKLTRAKDRKIQIGEEIRLLPEKKLVAILEL